MSLGKISLALIKKRVLSIQKDFKALSICTIVYCSQIHTFLAISYFIFKSLKIKISYRTISYTRPLNCSIEDTMVILGLFQTSNITCAESNSNDVEQQKSLIGIRFGTCEVRHLNQAQDICKIIIMRKAYTLGDGIPRKRFKQSFFPAMMFLDQTNHLLNH